MKINHIAVIASCLILISVAAACNDELNEYGLVANPNGALLSDEEKREPANATAGLEVAPGLEVTLFASEPMLINPTNIDIDAKREGLG